VALRRCEVKKRFVALAGSIGLVILLLTTFLANSTTVAQTDRTFNCLNPRAGTDAEPRIAFTGTLDDAQDFYQKTEIMDNLKGAIISLWTDGLPITIPTEEAVTELLTGTSHARSEVMSVYSKDASGNWVKGETSSSFLPTGNQATVEQVAINAVMAGSKPEYLPAILAMMSGGPNYKAGGSATGYVQIVSGPYAKEIGMNAGQGAMNPGNPPNMTIGRAFQLCLINLGGTKLGSNNTNLGNVLSRNFQCFAEDGEALPEGWVGMNEDVGYTTDESVIMLCQQSSFITTNFAPSSFRALNSGGGGMARKLGVEGKPGYYNFVEYLMEWSLMPQGTSTFPAGTPELGPQTAMCFVMCQLMAQNLHDYGFQTKSDFYQWVYNRTVLPASEYTKWGWYDVLTQNGTAIEPTSGKPYNALSPDYPVHVWGKAEDQLAIVSIYPGDESCMVFDGGRGIPRCIDPWK